MKNDLRASFNAKRNKYRRWYLSRDENKLKPHPRIDIDYFYCHKNGHIKSFSNKDWNP